MDTMTRHHDICSPTCSLTGVHADACYDCAQHGIYRHATQSVTCGSLGYLAEAPTHEVQVCDDCACIAQTE